MKIDYLDIRNFKSIRRMTLTDIEDALILVGKNNTGKTVVLDAIRAMAGLCPVSPLDFNMAGQRIVIQAVLSYTSEDMDQFHEYGMISKYKKRAAWDREVAQRLPSLKDGRLSFSYIVSPDGKTRYDDGIKRNNRYILQMIPKVYFIDSQRNLSEIESDILMFQEDRMLAALRANSCIFDTAKACNHCFTCIGMIGKKKPMDLDILETTRLMEYKLIHLNLHQFTKKVNTYFYRNGGYSEEISYNMNFDVDEVFKIRGAAYHRERDIHIPLDKMSKGMKSIYMLSLLEAYVDEGRRLPCIIMMEEPEIFLHPKLQKAAGEILYRLSKKNQVIFSTHSPNMIFNFTSGQIRQIVLDKDYYSAVRDETDIDEILDDLGYSANDLMNVSFVFIVEGKQDKSRLPLLLEKYYSEITDKDGKLMRIAIITTNSCTNIKTYANLKYMNQIYFKDHFLMIRDSDGKDRDTLKRQLCRYYDEQNLRDIDRLPRVLPRNVFILKYYSFENYFLNPAVMAAIGIIEKEEDFYTILFDKWRDYLHKLACAKNLEEKTGIRITSVSDLKKYIEPFKIYMRGHNLFDIFYGRYKKEEAEILKAYIDKAPKEDFSDILDAIDEFIYFESRKKGEDIRG